MENVTITGSISYVSLSFIEAVYRLLSERDVLTNAKIIKPSAVFCDLIKGKPFLLNQQLDFECF